MLYKKKITGITVELEIVSEEYASYILSLRLDNYISEFLNKVDNDVSKQTNWITEQKKREGDYYFLIKDLTGTPKGTISLYNIHGNSGEFGRWICTGSSLQSLESVILLHDFGFKILKLNKIYSRTLEKNLKVLNFHKRFGAKLIENKTNVFKDDQKLIIYETDNKSYEKIRSINFELIKRLTSQ